MIKDVMNDPNELEVFKRDIDLRVFAAGFGYAEDEKESWNRETVMRGATDKISIRLDQDGHWVYYSLRGENDRGSILDFVMQRRRLNFGQARKFVRVWTGKPRPDVPEFKALEPTPPKDLAKVRAEWAGMKPLEYHRYLEEERGIPLPVLLSSRFDGRVRVDVRSNAVFPHYDVDGLCGFEKRNWDFKGFAEDGEKGLWVSRTTPEDRAFVIGESAIDGFSYAALFPALLARYASIAGGLNPRQPDLIARALKRMPQGSEIVCITHRDNDGDRYAVVIESVAPVGLTFRRHLPNDVKDWNDVLKAGSFPAGPLTVQSV
jgi:hypothetical protein